MISAMKRIRNAQALGRLFGPGIQMPTFVMMFVTNRCDAKCPHCFYWRELNTKIREELTIDEFENLAQSIGPILQLTLTGGSPELRRDLAKIAEVFSVYCKPMNITMCMNGYHTERILSHVEKVLTRCPEQGFTVSLSLDGLGEEHSRFRGMKGLFERVVDTFHGLATIKRRFPNLRIHCGMCVTGLNYQTIHETAHWAQKNLPLDHLKITLVRESPTPPRHEAVAEGCTQTYLEVIEEQERRTRIPKMQKTSPRLLAAMAKEIVLMDLIREQVETGKCAVRCGATRENVTIYPDGTVVGCECRSETLGNLREVGMDLSKIWYNEAARRFRETLDRDGCGNHHHGYLALPIFRTPAMWPRLVRAAYRTHRNAREAVRTGQVYQNF